MTTTYTNTVETAVANAFNRQGHIVIRQDGNDELLIAKEDWFKDMPATSTYDDYGNLVDVEGWDEVTVKAHNFFNGSNFQTITIECSVSDTYYSRVDEETEEAILREWLDDSVEYRDAGTGLRSAESENYIFTKSIWAGHWEIASVQVK